MNVQQTVTVKPTGNEFITLSYNGQTYTYTHTGLDSACRLNPSQENVEIKKDESNSLPFLTNVLLLIVVDLPDFVISFINNFFDTLLSILLMFPEKDTSKPDNKGIYRGCVYYKPTQVVLQFMYEVT